jgi:menaquinone-dependent protoporphyrinogen oxidase
MTTLILYGTTEGQTRKIVGFMVDRLESAGHAVTVVEAIDAPGDLDLRRFGAVIVAASLHLGRYQTAVEDFVHNHAATLNSVRTAFVSVSLAAAGDDEDDVQGLAQCVADFHRRTGWTPSVLHHAAGAFRYTQYDFFKRWALKYIAWRKGGPTDTSRDYELTDWNALGRFLDGFIGSAS